MTFPWLLRNIDVGVCLWMLVVIIVYCKIIHSEKHNYVSLSMSCLMKHPTTVLQQNQMEQSHMRIQWQRPHHHV
jgi:hypothetical protein